MLLRTIAWVWGIVTFNVILICAVTLGSFAALVVLAGVYDGKVCNFFVMKHVCSSVP